MVVHLFVTITDKEVNAEIKKKTITDRITLTFLVLFYKTGRLTRSKDCL